MNADRCGPIGSDLRKLLMYLVFVGLCGPEQGYRPVETSSFRLVHAVRRSDTPVLLKGRRMSMV